MTVVLLEVCVEESLLMGALLLWQVVSVFRSCETTVMFARPCFYTDLYLVKCTGEHSLIFILIFSFHRVQFVSRVVVSML